MKPFQNNTKSGVLLAGGISILFGCLIFFIMLFLVGALGGCMGAAPANSDNPTKQVANPTSPVNLTPQPTAAPVLPEKRMVTIEHPKSLRVGDGDIIKMVIEVEEDGRITPTAEIAGHEVKISPIEIPNLYETHQIIAEARLDLAGIEVHPADSFTTAMLPGKPVVFYWSITAPNEGNFRGTLWLFLNLVPNDGGKPTRLTLLARRVDIEAVSFLGLGGSSARWIGMGGSALSFVFSIPFLETVISRIWKRFRHTANRSGFPNRISASMGNADSQGDDWRQSGEPSQAEKEGDGSPPNHSPAG